MRDIPNINELLAMSRCGLAALHDRAPANSLYRCAIGHLAGLQQALLGLAALALAGPLSDRVEPLWGGLVLLVAVLVLAALHPARASLLQLRRALDMPLAVLSLLAAGPAADYAIEMLSLARQAGPSCFLGQCAGGDRFADMAVLAIAIVVIGVLASARPRAGASPPGACGLRPSLSGWLRPGCRRCPAP